MRLARLGLVALGAVAGATVARGFRHFAEDVMDVDLALPLDGLDLDDIDASAIDQGLRWHLHEATIERWLRTPAPIREGHGQRLLFVEAEQGDAIARRFLAVHGLEDMLADNPEDAFVAYSVAELMAVVHGYAVDRALSRGDSPADVANATRAALVGAFQRIVWHTAAHFSGSYDVEPYGVTVDPADLPSLEA